MSPQLILRIEHAQNMLQNVRHAAMATVNSDGSPHNTPLFVAFSHDYQRVYWLSTATSQHSVNVQRDNQAFFVLYQSHGGSGLYFQGQDIHIATSTDLAAGLTVYNRARVANGKKQPLLLSAVEQPRHQRLYLATIREFAVNMSERDAAGYVIRDYREPVKPAQLMTAAEDAAIC